MKRSEILWLAFEKFAIFFSFIVTFVLVVGVLVLGYALWQAGPLFEAVADGLVCDTVTGVNDLLTDFEDAVITRTIYISQTIPVQFDLPLNQRLIVSLTDNVPLSQPATYVLPAGGGRINGTVHLQLPRGQKLPVRMQTTVPVDQQLPVEMVVPVSIPLAETDLGAVIARLRDLLAPLRLQELEETLNCRSQ
ncbi:MAG: hypothetical protein M8467_00210 [Anaerolineae bacterium]|nr:hypothetical protein [Anaerolineae bacterium]